MAFQITNKLVLAPQVKRIDLSAPGIARRARPGQFVMVAVDETAAWLPLSVVDADAARGYMTVIIRESDAATRRMGEMPIGEPLYAVMGPYGRPATIKKYGTVICAATGIHTARLLPVCRALKEAGNKVIGIIGARTRTSVMLEPQMRLTCHRLFMATEDGSYDHRGNATDLVRQELDEGPVDMVYAIGVPEMMRDVCRLTKNRKVPTFVQLNPVTACGNGTCGSCRVTVEGQTVLCCEEGPEFDGHRVDFDSFIKGMNARRHLETVLSSGQEGPGLLKMLFSPSP